ncbi:hypothetical protein [uncultured Fibrobacter sp.]|uniref:hypothetical protein n=1 Tax=uncultured Fibrobacter sp. TaxID=261512 RepID=UPI002594D8C9|nr:hypothetical protein [uncultured Fibrobacter sp.]
MSTRPVVNAFLTQIANLENRFVLIAQELGVQERPETVRVSFDVYNYEKTLIPYNRRIFFHDNREMYFIYNDIDASSNENRIRLYSTEGVADSVMLTDDIYYKDGLWYVWQPLNIDDILNGVGPDVSNLTELTDDKIRNIFLHFLQE